MSRLKILIDNLNELYGENVRLVKTLMKREFPDEYPEQLKWALQMLYFNGDKWVELCRIDNYPHENRVGSHVHAYGRKQVTKIETTFEEAQDRIKEISSRILKEKFHVFITFQ